MRFEPDPNFLVALGIGLLIGLMRERRRDDTDSPPSVAGLRTHAIASLAAAVAWHFDERAFLVFLAVGGALIAVSYRRTAESDVGLTSEFALLITILLGALAMKAAGLAAALGVVTALLLYLRRELHRLGRELITEQEVRDGMLLAASALVVLPVLSTNPIDPWGVIVPASLWKLVVLVMAAGVAGQVAVRMVGPRFGLPVAGFFAGFASSTAATVGYGQRVKADAVVLPYATSATLFANLATVILLAAVLATANAALLRAVLWPLIAACGVLLVAGAIGVFTGRKSGVEDEPSSRPQAFKLSHALALAAFVAVLLVVSAILADAIGDRGALAAAVIAGTVELQGSALAIGQLAVAGRLGPDEARWGIVLLLASSSATKSVLAFVSGGRGYGARVLAGLGAMVVAAGVAAWLTRAIS
jgi:uncharacterized membrane protein (DUF4010 family)